MPGMIRSLLRQPPRGDLSALDAFARDFARPGAAHRALAYYRQSIAPFLGWLFGKPYPCIEAPYRLVWSGEDAALSPVLSERLGAYFTHVPDVKRLPEAGHFLWLKTPRSTCGSASSTSPPSVHLEQVRLVANGELHWQRLLVGRRHEQTDTSACGAQSLMRVIAPPTTSCVPLASFTAPNRGEARR